ncbi:MAG: DNA polymerase IV [Bacillota bacterium]|nr:DNA polymerase IV [Bacillota bacterium]
MGPVILHADVNSAFLSFEAAYRLQRGEEIDLRTIPAVVGGDREKRRGIVLAKSIPSKKYDIQTGEPIAEALRKCPHLYVAPSNYPLYEKCSRALFALFRRYTDVVEQTGLEEGFLDISDRVCNFDEILSLAHRVRNAVREELGFTVSVGVSSNRLLAKMASDLRKPDYVTTLFPDEIPSKLWHLPVGDLIMVGRSTRRKLDRVGIRSIGDLAHADPAFLHRYLKSHGLLLWRYANGMESEFHAFAERAPIKSIGNSRTMPTDLTTREQANRALLQLCEKVCARQREAGFLASLVTVMYKNSQFFVQEHQGGLSHPTDHTNRIYEQAVRLFDEIWDGAPIRSMGVRVSELTERRYAQISFFDPKSEEKDHRLDQSIDHLRNRFGSSSLLRASLLGETLVTELSSPFGDLARDHLFRMV